MSFSQNSLSADRGHDNAVGRLVVKVTRADNVLAADVNGKSDPYVVLKVGDEMYKTSTQMKTLNPEWNEDFTFHVSIGKELKLLGTELVMNIWDWDKVGSDDFLGMHTLCVGDLPVGEKQTKTVDLRNRKNVQGKKVRGTLSYEVTLYPETEWGQSLDKLARRASRTGRDIPSVVSACISYLVANALETEGLFRIPGNRNGIAQLKEHFETGQESLSDGTDVHDVGGVLKLFLRELPEPLMSFELYDKFCDSSDDIKVPKDDAIRNERLKQVLDEMKEPSLKEILRQLCVFLKKVSEHAQSNKMGAHNLAIVFAPNLLRPRDESNVARVLADQPKACACIARLIEFIDELIPAPGNVGDVAEKVGEVSLS